MASICVSCKQECSEVEFNEGFCYNYGSIRGWHDESCVGSSCCGDSVVQGKVFLEVASIHTARRDHFRGDVKVISKGERYNLFLRKGYYIEDGVRHPIYEYRKRPLY